MVSGFVSRSDRPVLESMTLARASRMAARRLDPEKTAVIDAPGAIGVLMRQGPGPKSSEPGGHTGRRMTKSPLMNPSSFVAAHRSSVLASVAVSPTFITVTRACTTSPVLAVVGTTWSTTRRSATAPAVAGTARRITRAVKRTDERTA